ncbi:hypothetical protein VRK_42780 [Vibrio sp. MEBiC08052]|nr:hypothetical protein VRK_42780 [Vibrio sp. MEBiC08052]
MCSLNTEVTDTQAEKLRYLTEKSGIIDGGWENDDEGGSGSSCCDKADNE